MEDFILLDVFADSPLFHEPDRLHTRFKRGDLGLHYQPYPSNFIGVEEGWINKLDKTMKVAHDQQSARFTFHEKDYLPVPVPDAGSTALPPGHGAECDRLWKI